MKILHYKVLCGSFDRVTDTVWFNNKMTANSATSVSQTCTHPIPPPVPCYRQSIRLERSTLIHNKQQFFTSLCISGDNCHTNISTPPALAKRHNMRLQILQSMFSVGGMWPKLLSCFRNALKGVPCVETSVPSRNSIKYPVYKKLRTLT